MEGGGAGARVQSRPAGPVRGGHQDDVRRGAEDAVQVGAVAGPGGHRAAPHQGALQER